MSKFILIRDNKLIAQRNQYPPAWDFEPGTYLYVMQDTTRPKWRIGGGEGYGNGWSLIGESAVPKETRLLVLLMT